ncbi:MAG: hypothetical protein ACLPVY_03140 [Acidimicrobiia bacterium]
MGLRDVVGTAVVLAGVVRALTRTRCPGRARGGGRADIPQPATLGDDDMTADGVDAGRRHIAGPPDSRSGTRG